MHRRHLAATCIITALSLLVVVFSMWLKPLNFFDMPQKDKAEKICCLVPTSSTVYLSEIKPRIPGGNGNASGAIYFSEPLNCLRLTKTRLHGTHEVVFAEPAPIWLLHRSLLI